MELLDAVIMRSVNVAYTPPVGHAFSVVGQSKYVNGVLIAAAAFFRVEHFETCCSDVRRVYGDSR